MENAKLGRIQRSFINADMGHTYSQAGYLALEQHFAQNQTPPCPDEIAESIIEYIDREAALEAHPSPINGEPIENHPHFIAATEDDTILMRHPRIAEN